MMEETLKKIGLNEKEAQVYRAVLEHGRLSSTALSKLTGINRTTIYSTSKELIKKGLIAEDIGATVRQYVALSPRSIEHIIEREQEMLNEKKRWALTAVREASAVVRGRGFSLPKVMFVEEGELRAYLTKQTPVWNESIAGRDGIYWGFQDRYLVQHYEDWIDEYWAKHASARVINELRLISDEEAEKRKGKKYPYRKIKFWKQATDFSSTTWVMGDYVVMIAANKRPHYLVEIYDETLAQNMRAVFKGLWEEIG